MNLLQRSKWNRAIEYLLMNILSLQRYITTSHSRKERFLKKIIEKLNENRILV